MKKRILIPAILLLIGCFIALTVLGRQMIPKAPITVAWLAPLGQSGYLQAVEIMVPIGSNREHVERVLGEPHKVMRSITDSRRFTLLYEIPNSAQKSEIMISFVEDQKVRQIELLPQHSSASPSL